MELNHVTVIFTLTLRGDIADRYSLFSLRAPFEEAFRQGAGCRRGECRGCLKGGDCAFKANFSQELSRDPEAVRRHQKPPLPFVFQMPVLPPPPNRGTSLQCSLTLFGSAINYFDSYLAAACLLFPHIPAEVSTVQLLTPGGSLTPLPSGAGAAGNPLPLLSAGDPLAAGPLAADRVTVEFVTPLRLVSDGKVVKEVTFSHIARALLRRASAIAYYYGGTDLPLDYPTLSAASQQIFCTGSDCRFTQWGKNGGIVGRMVFSGDLEEFHLLLLLGRVMNLGKGASFGFGEFRLG